MGVRRALIAAGAVALVVTWAWREPVQGQSGQPEGSPAPAAAGPSPTRLLLPLSDDWLPAVFSDNAEHPQQIRTVLLRLANEQLARLSGTAYRHVRSDRHFELYGVFPSFTVLGRRLLDEHRHRCHDEVDDVALAVAVPKRRPDRAAVRAIQQHLRCDGVLAGQPARSAEGRLDGRTLRALGAYRRRHMLPGAGRLDDETRSLLISDSRELDFRALLRTLRERVADAAALIEDGSAAGVTGTVLGRALDPQEIRRGMDRAAATAVRGRAAPDLVAPAVEAAARALGWTTPAAAAKWFADRELPRESGGGFRLPRDVQVTLPPAPVYHGPHMDLRVEIDRGDVLLAAPGTKRRRVRRPTLTVYARDAAGEIALLRWPTTVGGWQPYEQEDGSLWLRHSQSRVGAAEWRDLLAAPTWYPPPGVPVRSLLTRTRRGLEPRGELIGPGYRAAYGLIAFVHEERRTGEAGTSQLRDYGIRTHGTPSHLSVARGNSHGCHRLYNHLALRLGGFLLQHRSHLRHGAPRQPYQRVLVWEDQEIALESEHRGYRYELVPPVPVQVLPGVVRGSRAAVARDHPLPPPPGMETSVAALPVRKP